MIPFDALVKFSVTNWTEIAGMSISLIQVVRAFHKALIPSTMAKSKHVTKFVSRNFANSHKHDVFFFLRAIVMLTCEILGESVNALNSSKRWNPITKAVVT